MNIDLLSPESFAAGHPLAQYRWLRENQPVFWLLSPVGRPYDSVGVKFCADLRSLKARSGSPWTGGVTRNHN